MKKPILLLVLLLSLFQSPAQIKKFGRISADEFTLKDNPQYKNDDAIELFKKRNTRFEYNQNEGWVLITEVHERILLKNKNGFKYATKAIKLYDKERLKIRAATYNLNDGKIDVTKLDRNSIYRQDLYLKWYEKKFTMPNLKEGSIVEWYYKIKSPYLVYIDDVVYQRPIPIRYLEAKVVIPEYFNFNYYTTKYTPVQLDVYKDNLIYEGGASATTTVFSLKLQNVAPIKNEPYISHINSYIGRIRFNLNYIKIPGQIPQNFSKTWEDVCETIYGTSEFGGQLKKNAYFKNDLVQICSPTDSLQGKLNKILAFVKSKVRWNNKTGIFANNGVVQAYKSGKGNVAEINFIFIAMLRQAGIEAYPVLAATIDHGIPIFPTIFGFNYVITAVKNGNEYILIDPTETYAPPGVLPRRILNWFGRVVKKDGTSEMIKLFPGYYNLSVNNINASIDDTSIKDFGNVKKTGNLALKSRKILDGLDTQQLVAALNDEYQNANIQKARVRQLRELDKPLNILYQFEMENALEEVGNKYIFYPALFLRQTENPFKSDTRTYPIFFGYPFIHLYVIDIKIPPAYQIQKLPENISLSLPEDMGTYDYQIQRTPMGIRLQISLKISEPVIPVTRYKLLKDFFDKMVKQENSPVVLSKQ